MPLVNMPFEENDKPEGTRTTFPDPDTKTYEFYDEKGLILGVYSIPDKKTYGRPEGTERIKFNEKTKIATFFDNKGAVLGSYDENTKRMHYLTPQKNM